MSGNTPPATTNNFSEELVQRAKDCLTEKEEEIDYFVDSWQASYQTAQIDTLAKYLHLDKHEARKLFNQLFEQSSDISSGSSERIRTVESSIAEILENPYNDFVEEFISIYDNFCADYAIEANAPVPENLRNTVIFEFPASWGELRQIPLWLAHFLMKSHNRKKSCQDFFISAGSIDMIETLFKM